MRKEKMRKPKVSYDTDFFRKSAEDFSKRIKLNDYEFGRKVIEALSGVLDSNFKVLEIGTGPGTLTVPLSKTVKKVVGIEFSEENTNHLKANLKGYNLRNVEIINADWEKVNDYGIKDKFNLVICSHFLWQVKDIREHLERMENASKRYCAVIQPCGRDELVKDTFESVINQRYTGQFEPDADYFAYTILREGGRLVNVRHFDYTFERNLEEEIRCIAGFIARFTEVDQAGEETIRNYLLDKSENGKYIEKNRVVVMWWEPEK